MNEVLVDVVHAEVVERALQSHMRPLAAVEAVPALAHDVKVLALQLTVGLGDGRVDRLDISFAIIIMIIICLVMSTHGLPCR